MAARLRSGRVRVELLGGFRVVVGGVEFGDSVWPSRRNAELVQLPALSPRRWLPREQVGAGEHRVEGGGELAVPVTDQKPEPLGAVAELHQQVAGLLGHPAGGGMGGDPGDVHAAAAVLDHHQDIEAT
jgi:hypothetical protein